MEYFKFISHVVDKELKTFKLDVPTYSKLVPKFKSSFDFNFISPYYRCVFMYRYATSILYFTEICISEFFQCFAGTNQLLSLWKDKKIYSVSFGPCLDYLALQKAIVEFSGSAVKFDSIHVSTQFGTWKNTFKFIIDTIKKGNLKQLTSLPLANIEFFQKKDPLKAPADLLSQHDLILMVKALNLQSPPNDDNLFNKLKDLVSHVKTDGIVLFLDNRLSANLLLKVLAIFPGYFLYEPKYYIERIPLVLPETYKQIHGELPVVSTHGAFFVWKKSSPDPLWIAPPRFVIGDKTTINIHGKEFVMLESESDLGLNKTKASSNSLNSSSFSLASVTSDPGSDTKNGQVQNIQNLKINLDEVCMPSKNKESISESVNDVVLTSEKDSKENQLDTSSASPDVLNNKAVSKKLDEVPNVIYGNTRTLPLYSKVLKSNPVQGNSLEILDLKNTNSVENKHNTVENSQNYQSPSSIFNKEINNCNSESIKENSCPAEEKSSDFHGDMSLHDFAANQQSSIESLTNRIKLLASKLENDISGSNSSGASASSEINSPRHDIDNTDAINVKYSSENRRYENVPSCCNCCQPKMLHQNSIHHCSSQFADFNLGKQQPKSGSDSTNTVNFCSASEEHTNNTADVLNRDMCTKCQYHNPMSNSCSQNFHCGLNVKVQQNHCFHQHRSCLDPNHFNCEKLHSCSNHVGPHASCLQGISSSCCREACFFPTNAKSEISVPSLVIPLDGIDANALIQMILSLKKDSRN